MIISSKICINRKLKRFAKGQLKIPLILSMKWKSVVMIIEVCLPVSLLKSIISIVM